jgi:hypothetical protein
MYQVISVDIYGQNFEVKPELLGFPVVQIQCKKNEEHCRMFFTGRDVSCIPWWQFRVWIGVGECVLNF